MNSTLIESLTSRRFSETELGVRVEKCLPNLLLEQVLMRPDSTAVVYGQERLSYRELAESSLFWLRTFSILVWLSMSVLVSLSSHRLS